jgi:hypothetical protein
MDAIEDDILFLKSALKTVLAKLSGEATVNELEKALVENYGEIDLQVVFFDIFIWMLLDL